MVKRLDEFEENGCIPMHCGTGGDSMSNVLVL